MDKYILPDFFIIPTEVALDEDLQPLDGYVYGLVYWYTKLKLERCTASNLHIALILSRRFKKRKIINPKSVSNSLQRLAKKKYVKVILNVLNQREEVIPLVTFTQEPTPPSNNVGSKRAPQRLKPTPPPSDDVPPYIISSTPPTSNDVQNKNNKTRNIEKDKDISTNVLIQPEAEKKEYGDAAVNAMCQLFEEAYGHLPNRSDQRRYAKLLLNKFSPNIALRGAKYAIDSAEDAYAPKITSPKQLWYKWADLVAYGKKGLKTQSRSFNVSAAIRHKKGLTDVS